MLKGGFGPVSNGKLKIKLYKMIFKYFFFFVDGYGISYIVAGEDLIFFHISSLKSCAPTSSESFSKQICKSLADMKLLFEDYKREQVVLKEKKN